jgi:5'-nucleotidase
MIRKESKMRSTRISLVVMLLVVLLSASGAVSAAPPDIVEVQILAFNDFHGALLPPSGSSGRVSLPAGGTVDAGGAVYLATHIHNLAATNPNTVLVSAGDMIGASPLISALFHDEPTIEMLNLLGMKLSTVGNHEFDEGWQELLRMQQGGCHPVDGCLDGDPFYGFDGKFLSANVIKNWNNQTLFPPYKVLTFQGVKVAFIGIAYEATPSIVVPSGVEGLTFLSEIETTNALVRELKAKQIKNIVVLIHNGGSQTGFYNECVNPTGTFFDYVNQLHPEVDVVISAHSHYAYNCLLGRTVVTQAMSNGRIVTEIDLTINARSGNIVDMTANNVVVTRNVPADSSMQALVDKYNNLVLPVAGQVLGSITADITRAGNAAGESALGDVIADAQLFDTAPADRGGAVMAFMNPGGIRADLVYNNTYYQEAPGEITYGEAFNVQPFYNNLVTMDLTGAHIHTLLEQQWMGGNWSSPKVLQVSNGFAYEWSSSGPEGDRVDPASITLNGVPIDPAVTYRVTVNSFLAGGGDNFTVLTEGTNLLFGGMDIDALASYFAANSPLAPGPQNRITVVP